MPVNSQPATQTNGQAVAQIPEIAERKKFFSNKKILVILSIIILLIATLGSLFLVFVKKDNTSIIPTNKISTLTFWGRSVDADIMAERIQEFESQNPNIKIVYDKQGETNYEDKLATRLSINNIEALPDIAEIDDAWVDELSPYLFPITDTNIKNRFAELSIANNSVGGIMIAVPFRFDTLALAYNKTYISQYLAETKQSEVDFNKLDWSSLMIKARGLTKSRIIKDPNDRTPTVEITRGGIAIGSPRTVTNAGKILQLLLIQNNVEIYDTTQGAFVLGQKFNDIMEFYTGFNTNEGIWNDYLGNDLAAFSQGRVAMVLVKSEDIDELKNLNPNLDFVTSLPAKIGSVQNISFSRSLAIPRTKPNSAAAMKFVEFLSRPENGTKLYNSKSSNTFIPAQRDSLDSIEKSSPFAIFSSINPTAAKFKVPKYTRVTEELNNFLEENYELNFAGLKKGDTLPKFEVFPSKLERTLNTLEIVPTLTKQPQNNNNIKL